MIYQDVDVAIVGGGMIGGTLAIGLAQQGLTVAVIERMQPSTFTFTNQPDIRISAISMESINLLHRLGIWKTILEMRVHPYNQLEIWTWENIYLKFKSLELNTPLFGYMVENSILRLALLNELQKRSRIILHIPSSLKSLQRINNRHLLVLDNNKILSAKLLIGADGANSQVRQIAGIGIRAWQYRQYCMLITVECVNNPGNTAWQYFTQNGPRAFLPLFGFWASLVWYDTPARIRQLQEMSMIQLQHEIKNHFPLRLNEVKPVATSVFPIIRRHAIKYILDRLVLVGDAAHTIHPLAGQGLNLGYRDVAALLAVLSDARRNGEVWESEKVLRRYQKQRIINNFMIQSLMDLCYASFSTNRTMLRILFNTALITVKNVNILKHQAMKHILGLR